MKGNLVLRPLNELILKIKFSEEGNLLARCRIEREKFYPGQGIEPGYPALRASTLPLSYPAQTSIHDGINLL